METPQEKKTYPGSRFDAVKRNVERLHNIMQDPQFGYFTWHQSINEEMLELQANYFDREFEGEKT